MAWWKKTSTAPADDAKAAADMPLIRLEGISKVFKDDADEETWALRNVTLDIERGEYCSVSGPSGCGKSTFLSILALLDTPSSGHYWLNGKRTDQLTPAERTRARSLDVGLVFQSFNLIGDMTVYESFSIR
jgi:putative ABC transport system ATP-binding protein